MMRVRAVACASLLALTAGCGTIDPFRQPGTWRPEAVNERNLAAMAANPADLYRGHGEARPQPRLATNAVRRLLAGAPNALPTLSGDTEPGSGGGSGGSAAPATGGGAAPANP